MINRTEGRSLFLAATVVFTVALGMLSSSCALVARSVPSEVDTLARSIVQGYFEGLHPYRASTEFTKLTQAEEPALFRPFMKGTPTVRFSEDSGKYWHADFCYEAGAHVYVAVWEGPPAKLGDFFVHRVGDSRQDAFEPCRGAGVLSK